MKVTNISSRARTVAATQETVEPGEQIDVPADVGKALVDQDHWSTGKAKRKEGDVNAPGKRSSEASASDTPEEG